METPGCMSCGETDHPLGQRTRQRIVLWDPGGAGTPAGERRLVLEGPATVVLPSTIKKKSQFRLFSVRRIFTFLKAI